MASTLVFDHLKLDDVSRRLISTACGKHATVVFLAPLDKGLSGSTVWLARWKLSGGSTTKHHVFKIGPRVKLERERTAIADIASSIDVGFPNVEIYYDPETPSDDRSAQALLRQEFVGQLTGEPVSLRGFILRCTTVESVQRIMTSLYANRMKTWHVPTTEQVGPQQQETLTLRMALDWWTTRMNLRRAAGDLGRQALDNSLTTRLGIGLADLGRTIGVLGKTKENCVIGPVHGDLHAQNVLIDADGHTHLIDFGWTAYKWRCVDFLMMECSLKFLVTPSHATLDDLIDLDRAVDARCMQRSGWKSSGLCGRLHGRDLHKIAAAIHVVRRSALLTGAARDMKQYRRGLLMLMGGLTSLRGGINRVYLFHSIGYNLGKEHA